MAITYLSNMSIDGTLTLTVNADADSTYTGIVVVESGLLKYRTKAQIKSDIGAGSGSGTVTSVGISAGTGISVSGSPVTGSGSITVTNSAPDQTVALTGGTGITISGTYPNFTITNSSPSSGGTITGSGTSGRLAKFNGSTSLTNSRIFESVSGTFLYDTASYPFTIQNDGGINIFKFEGQAVSNSSNLQITPGTETKPGLNFGKRSGTGATDTNTGIYSSATDHLEISTGGSKALGFDSSQDATFSGQISASTGGINTSADLNSTGDPGLLIQSGARLGFDQSGTRSWTLNAASGNLNVNSGDGNGSFSTGTKGIICGDLTASGNITGANVGSTTQDAANIFKGSVISSPSSNSLGLILRNSSDNAIIGSLLRTSASTSQLTTDTLSLPGTTSQYIRGDGSVATFPSAGVSGSGTTSTIPLWASSTQLSDSPLTYDGSDQIKLSAGTPEFRLYDTSSTGSLDLSLNGVHGNLQNNSANGNIEITTQTGGGVGINTSGTVGSALDVNGTVRVRNQLNVGETTEQNLFVAGGSLTDGGERYAKFGYYGEAELLTPGGTASSQLADTKRTTAAFGTSGKLLEDLQYVVIKVEPAGWVNRYGLPYANPSQSAILAVQSYGQNTIIVLDHVTVWKSYDQGGGSSWTQGDFGGIPAYQIVQYESANYQRGALTSVQWTYPAALANYTGAFAYTRPAFVGQGTEKPAGQPYAIINNKRALANKGLYIQTYENYTSARMNANHYIRLAYRVFRRGADFVDATALTITAGGDNGSGSGGTFTSFTRTTSTAVFNDVCSATGSATAYHNGSGTYPVGGDNVYTTSDGSGFLAGGYYKIAANNSWIRITGGSGEVTATGSC